MESANLSEVASRSVDIPTASGQSSYASKDTGYFAGARKDYVDLLPPNKEAAILEIGCGNGNTGALALANGKCGRYCGIEICEEPAQIAKQSLSEVLVCDVESTTLPWAQGSFDVLIMSEVLEHLADPWATLRKIRPLMKKNALVFASSPNVSHLSIVRMLIRGRWDLTEQGVMDRTHLRWFTPTTFEQMFQTCGYIVDKIGPLAPMDRKARIFCTLTGGWGEHLFVYQINLHGHCE